MIHSSRFALLLQLVACVPENSASPDLSGFWEGTQIRSPARPPEGCPTPEEEQIQETGMEIARLADGRGLAIVDREPFFGDPEADLASFVSSGEGDYVHRYDLRRDEDRLVGEMLEGSPACATRHAIDLGRVAGVRAVPDGIAGRWLLEGEGCVSWFEPLLSLTIGDAGEVSIDAPSPYGPNTLSGSIEGDQLRATGYSTEMNRPLHLSARIGEGSGSGTLDNLLDEPTGSFKEEMMDCSGTITLTRLDTELDR